MIRANILGIDLEFHTSPGVFSPKRVDAGTLAMLSRAGINEGDRVLDLGCGYGAAGIYAAKVAGAQNVVMSDVCGECVALAKKNAALNGMPGIKAVLSDAFDGIDEKDFNLILSNPPYHSDFKVPKIFIEKGFNRLALGGRMLMVTKRREWYKNKFISVFGGVQIEEEGGYFIFNAARKAMGYNKQPK